MGQQLGFTVETMPTGLLDNARLSSTRVRKALSEGDHLLVDRLLGRPYAMMGRVRRGDQRGRQIGFPTANIFLQRKLTPVKGVYVVYMRGLDPANPDKTWPGVANVGQRPTFDGTRTLLEVHLLDFNQDIYGRHVEVEFCTKVRNEEKYASFDALKEQIAKDVRFARDYFHKLGVL
jgi:riboflavin kinase/FMN adenylyltransferase